MMVEPLSPTSTTSSADVAESLSLVEVKPGLRFSLGVLRDILPDAETVLFFGKVYGLDYRQLSNLMATVLQSDLAKELFGGAHSLDLQSYVIGGYEHADWCASLWHERDLVADDYHCNCSPVWVDGIVPSAQKQQVTFDPVVPHGEILPAVWESLEVEVASSIQAVATKLESVVGLLPGKQGEMVLRSMMKLNKQRPTIGVHQARIDHAPQKQNLVIFDDSGSVTRHTVEAIVDDVVALSYKANAHFALVSNTCRYWEPGSYGTDDVLARVETGGTHYETLEDLFDRDWGVVITIADYDSSMWAKEHLAANCTGRIDTVLDISLVNRPSFLAECVGQLAGEVRPLLIAQGSTPRTLTY